MGAYVPYDESQEGFLNNFHERFPLGESLMPKEGLARFVIHRENSWDIINRTRFGNIFKKNKSLGDVHEFCFRFSDKFLDQTPREFFTEVDKTALECRLSVESITERIVLARGTDLQTYLARDDYLRPVYIALRMKGYNKKELWG